MKKRHDSQAGKSMTTFCVVACAILMQVLPAGAAVVAQTPVGNNTGFTVSAVDLLETDLDSSTDALVLNVGENNGAGGKTSAVLNNGVFGNVQTNGKLESVVIDYGQMTYTLDTSVNTLGYNITSIVTYAGWADANRGTQAYTVEYSTVASTNFATLVVVPFNKDGFTQQQIAIIENTTGILASGVDAIRFDFGDVTGSQEFSGVGYKELDVLGEPTEGLYEGPVTVPNYSFEDPILSSGALHHGAISGWTRTGSGFIFHPSWTFNDVTPLGAPAHSNQCAIFETGEANPGAVMYTTSSSLGSVLPHHLYTLTVAVGHGKQTSPAREPDDYMVELLLDGSTVASNTLSNAYTDVPFGEWVDLSTSFTATKEQLGGALTARITHSSDDATHRQGAADNVRVTSAYTPPGSVLVVR